MEFHELIQVSFRIRTNNPSQHATIKIWTTSILYIFYFQHIATKNQVSAKTEYQNYNNSILKSSRAFLWVNIWIPTHKPIYFFPLVLKEEFMHKLDRTIPKKTDTKLLIK